MRSDELRALPLTVLVVDDEDSARRTLEFLLEDEGHRVVMAENGIDAITKTLSERPDVILMDIGMPIMDGYQAAERIRSERSIQNIPIVACTGVRRDFSDTSEHLFDAVIVKPFTVQEVVDTIEAVRPRSANGFPSAGKRHWTGRT